MSNLKNHSIAAVLLCSGLLWGCDPGGDTPYDNGFDGTSLPRARPPHDPAGGRGSGPANASRETIESLEEILYKKAPAQLDDADRIIVALNSLYEILSNSEPEVENATELLFLAGNVGARADTGYTVIDLSWARKEWERLRSTLFGSQPWFRKSTPEIEKAQKPPKPTADPALVAKYLATIDALERLITEARVEVEDLGEPIYQLERVSSDGNRQIQRWREWGRGWTERLKEATKDLPPMDLDGDPKLLMASNIMGQVLSQLHQLPLGAGSWPTPFRGGWEQKFEMASIGFQQIRQELGRTR